MLQNNKKLLKNTYKIINISLQFINNVIITLIVNKQLLIKLKD